MQATFDFPVIAPLILRHVEDAAFYWSQLDNSADSPTTDFARLTLFNKLLDAHLAGLDTAGPAGWKPSITMLQRWQKPGEAYVCTALAIGARSGEQLDSVLHLLAAKPAELLRGVISALAWRTDDQALTVVARWSAPTAPACAQVAAIRAAALIGQPGLAALASPLPYYLDSGSAYVRAAACRAAGAMNDGEIWQPLHNALADEDLAVRAEAAIALACSGTPGKATQVLAQCVSEQAGLHATATGWFRKQAKRRLMRWVRHLAWNLPIGGSDTTAALAALAPREALTFILCHGDVSHLDLLVEHMDNAEVSRYAGWVWQSLSGIDLAASGLAMPESVPSLIDPLARLSSDRQDADNGLLRPNVKAVRTCPAINAGVDASFARILLGKVLSAEHAVRLIASAPQAIRLIAANYINHERRGMPMNVRAPAPRQRAALVALHETCSRDSAN